jgi:hypothetical protein
MNFRPYWRFLARCIAERHAEEIGGEPWRIVEEEGRRVMPYYVVVRRDDRTGSLQTLRIDGSIA